MIFVAASQTGLDTRSKAWRPIKTWYLVSSVFNFKIKFYIYSVIWRIHYIEKNEWFIKFNKTIFYVTIKKFFFYFVVRKIR